jgi:hypothetical protein
VPLTYAVLPAHCGPGNSPERNIFLWNGVRCVLRCSVARERMWSARSVEVSKTPYRYAVRKIRDGPRFVLYDQPPFWLVVVVATR